MGKREAPIVYSTRISRFTVVLKEQSWMEMISYLFFCFLSKMVAYQPCPKMTYTKTIYLFDDIMYCSMDTLPETNSSPLKKAIPEGNDRIPTLHFQMQAVSFKEGSFQIMN